MVHYSTVHLDHYNIILLCGSFHPSIYSDENLTGKFLRDWEENLLVQVPYLDFYSKIIYSLAVYSPQVKSSTWSSIHNWSVTSTSTVQPHIFQRIHKNINYFHFKLILLIDLLNITVYYQNEIHHMKRIYCCCIRFMNITFYGNEIRKWVEACVCHSYSEGFWFRKKKDYRGKIWMHYSFFFLQKFYPNLLKHLFRGRYNILLCFMLMSLRLWCKMEMIDKIQKKKNY